MYLEDATILRLENCIVGSTGMAERNQSHTLQQMARGQLPVQLF
jgi:hypothetical protein